MIGAWIDRAIGAISPQWALNRLAARATMSQIDGYFGGQGGYAAGRYSRLNPYMAGQPVNENAVSRGQIYRLRQQSWQLYRDNTSARKIIRNLETKVVGRYPMPVSHATLPNGEPHLEFQDRARRLWKDIYEELDYRGRPGRGGQDLVDLHKVALRCTILGGEVFPRFRYLTSQQQRQQGLTLPLKLQLIHADRIDETLIDDRIFYGVEFDDNEQRVAYHVLEAHPSDPRFFAKVGDVRRVPAKEMTHLYVSEDVDQIRGVPWFSAALLKMKDTSEYEYHELQAAAISACIALGYRRSNGQAGGLSVNAYGQGGPTDFNGNAITALQPGMLIDLGQTGQLESFNPQRPNANAEAFIQHMQRSMATGVPGVKSSTLTGDYRGSSFSSERAADNDVWPEIEGIQDWFFTSFSQPIYEEIIRIGVESGYFDGVRGFSLRDFTERLHEYVAASWQGPVAKSIKPSEDETASKMRKANGRSSPQKEAAMAGTEINEVMQEIVEFIETARQRGLPEEWIMSAIGVESTPVQLTSEDSNDGDEEETESEAGLATSTA